MPILHANGTTLFYEIHGSGMPLLFIHHHGFSHEMFFPQIKDFSKRYKVILVDLRGNGKSGRLGVPLDEVVKSQCLDIKMLLDHLGISCAVFVGVADGGVLVQHFSMLYPERVSAIVLSDSSTKKAAAGWLGKLGSAFQAATWLTYYLPGEFFVRALKVTYYRWDIAYSFLRNGMLNKRPTEWIKQRLALSEASDPGRLSRIRVPAICIVGDFSPEGVSRMRETAAMIPDADLALIEDAFVPSNLCQPRQFNDTVMGFLETHKERIEAQNNG